ncbi:MAG: DUF4422 domain-containing protein [Pseudoramibacter sp.]
MKDISGRIQIIVATHKKYRMPEDPMYLPLHVGAEGKTDGEGHPLDLGYVKDNTGDNISEKNAGYCELTGLYWAWKHLQADYIGLVHYRRYFVKKPLRRDRFQSILTYEDLAPLLDQYQVFVPKKRRYYIETLYSHYAHTHYAVQLDTTRDIIKQYYPDYIEDFDRITRKSSGYMFNMMIMARPLVDEYCAWLFKILAELEQRVDMSELSPFQRRYFGRIGEIIFNVWLAHQVRAGRLKASDIKTLSYANMEKTNWLKKGFSFLRAKFFHRKYEGSF